MKPWIIYAIISMFFAGVTSVIAKMGLAGISSDLGILIRTGFVFAIVVVFAVATLPRGSFAGVSSENLWWLAVSAATTSASWIFYYKALKDGEVSTIALIDKGSIIIAIVLACVIFKEQITARMIFGGALIIGGLAIIATK